MSSSHAMKRPRASRRLANWLGRCESAAAVRSIGLSGAGPESRIRRHTSCWAARTEACASASEMVGIAAHARRRMVGSMAGSTMGALLLRDCARTISGSAVCRQHSCAVSGGEGSGASACGAGPRAHRGPLEPPCILRLTLSLTPGDWERQAECRRRPRVALVQAVPEVAEEGLEPPTRGL